MKLLGEGTFVLHYATAAIDDVASCARLTGLTTREKPRRPKVTHLAPKSRAIRARALTMNTSTRACHARVDVSVAAT